jgi:hypothetical protein
VGIGTSSPTQPLHISKPQGAALIQSTTSTNSVYLAFNNGGGTSYVGVDTSTGSIFSSGAYGMTLFNAANSATTFFTNATERMRIPAAGGVQSAGSISVGGATPTTSGIGITFPATQSASSDANTLDDYEEGTWTPVLSFGGASVGIAYTYQSGFYTKIGNTVTVQYVIFLSSKGSSTGNNQISGLPFSTANNDTKRAGAYQFNDRITPNQALSNNNATTFSFQSIPATSASSASTLTNTDFSATTYISGTFTYLL